MESIRKKKQTIEWRKKSRDPWFYENATTLLSLELVSQNMISNCSTPTERKFGQGSGGRMSITGSRNGRRLTQTRTVQILGEKGGKLQFWLPYHVLGI